MRIVDAGIETLGIKAQRVGDPQRDHFAVHERSEAVVLVSRRDRHVVAEPDRIMLIDPGVVARFGAVVADALKTGARIFVEGPSLLAVIARCSRSVQRTFAL